MHFFALNHIDFHFWRNKSENSESLLSETTKIFITNRAEINNTQIERNSKGCERKHFRTFMETVGVDVKFSNCFLSFQMIVRATISHCLQKLKRDKILSSYLKSACPS